MREVPTNATTRGSSSTVRRTRLHATGSSVTDGRCPIRRAACSAHTVRETAIARASSQVAPQLPPGIARASELEVDEGTIGSLHHDEEKHHHAQRDGAEAPRAAVDEALERALA